MSVGPPLYGSTGRFEGDNRLHLSIDSFFIEVVPRVEGLGPVFIKGFLVTRTLLDYLNCLFVQLRIALVVTIIYISRIIAFMRFGLKLCNL